MNIRGLGGLRLLGESIDGQRKQRRRGEQTPDHVHCPRITLHASLEYS
jgi:hypothetical protein